MKRVLSAGIVLVGALWCMTGIKPMAPSTAYRRPASSIQAPQ